MGKAEGIVENYLRKQAKKHGCLCYKFTSPGTRGVPDEILIYKGKILFIETKSETGEASEIQKKRIAEMKHHGADVKICNTRTKIDKALSSLIDNYKSGQPQKTAKNKIITTKPCKIKNSIRT